MNSSVHKIAITFLVVLPIASYAAPFCAVFSFGKQCFYYSVEQCQKAAGSQGACIVNQDEARTPSGGAPFCVVTSAGTNCFYFNNKSCQDAAQRSNGACVVKSD
jgi:hypothetical protein